MSLLITEPDRHRKSMRKMGKGSSALCVVMRNADCVVSQRCSVMGLWKACIVFLSL